MADELEGSAQSLSALAVERGLIPGPERDRLLDELVQQRQAKTPTSFARLLIRDGVSPSTVQNLLATGAPYPAVRCDGCGQPIPQGLLPERREYPCPACGTFLLGFAAFLRSPPPKDEEDSEETEKLPVITPRQVGRFSPSEVASGLGEAPPPSGSNVTDRYDQVLPTPPVPLLRPELPEEEEEAPAGVGGVGGTTLTFKDVLKPGDKEPISSEEAEQAGGRTIEFQEVLGAPKSGSGPIPSDVAEQAGGRTIVFGAILGAPIPPQVAERAGGRTRPFGDVFVLPAARRPLSESQVQDQMSTLLAPGATYMDMGEVGPGGGFDPEGHTIPTGRTAAQLKADEGARATVRPPPPTTPPRPSQNPFASQSRPVAVPPPPPTPPPPRTIDNTILVGPPPAMDATIEGQPPPALLTPPPQLDATIPPGYGEEATTVPPDQIYAAQGPKMPGSGKNPTPPRIVGVKKPGRTGPRVWPWVLALVLLLGAAAGGLYLLLTS